MLNHRLLKGKLTAVLAAFVSVLVIVVGCVTAKTDAVSSNTPSTAVASQRLVPGPNDGRIGYVVARLLESFHYLQRPLDKDLSVKFYNGYIDTLDPNHETFLQSDLAEFDHYRTNLDLLTVGDDRTADLTPAYDIFDRFLERTKERTHFVEELLDQDNFTFTGDDKIQLDRRHAPFPKDLAEAQDLWQQRLRYDYLQEKLNKEISPTNDTLVVPVPDTAATNIAATLRGHYDWNMRVITNWDSTKVLEFYLNALAHAYDPHTDYFAPERAQDFSIGMSLSLFGIGAQLGEDDGYCTIRQLITGGPADKSKQLNEKDRILAVAQSNQPPVDVVDMDLDKVVQLIRGPKGTQVQLTISPASNPAKRQVVTLVRDIIKLEDSEAKAKLIELPDDHGGTNRLGVINIPSFYAPVDLSDNPTQSTNYVAADVAKLIQKLKRENVSGIILDLRNNPGGSLEEAVKFTGLFIKEGPVVLARNPDGQVTVDSDNDTEQLYSGPLAVMINRFSASASEIAAAALQDYGRAVIVGDPTHGKGTVQNLDQLKAFVGPVNPTQAEDPGTIKITIRKFYRVSGASTQLRGVVPDITLPDQNVLVYSDQAGESALDNPLPWDTVDPVNYDKLNLVQPYLTQLREDSKARIATNQDFRYINHDIAQFKKLQADKTIVLNEKDELKERLDINAQDKTREEEREGRKPLNEKVYDITLENADNPGLPTPEDETNAVASLASLQGATAANVATNLPGTNSLPAAVNGAKTPPEVDAMLDETEHILEDYISLLAANKTMTAGQ
jgi:carboxyl-terminal processing protease